MQVDPRRAGDDIESPLFLSSWLLVMSMDSRHLVWSHMRGSPRLEDATDTCGLSFHTQANFHRLRHDLENALNLMKIVQLSTELDVRALTSFTGQLHLAWIRTVTERLL